MKLFGIQNYSFLFFYFNFFFSSKWSSTSGTLPVSSNNCGMHFVLIWDFYQILTALSVLSQLGGVFTALKYTVFSTCLQDVAS